MTLTKEHVLKQLKRVYRYQAANQTRSVIRRSGATRFIKDTDWERGVFWSCASAAWMATDDNEYLDGGDELRTAHRFSDRRISAFC